MVDFTVPADHIVKSKEEQILGPWQRTKKVVENESDNDKIVIGALETVFKGKERWLEELEIGGQIEIIQIAALLRSARILEKS